MVGSSGGAWNSNGGGFAGSVHGGARPQTAEIIKTFGERCPDVVVNNKLEKADYVVTLDHEGGKGVLRRRNKVAVFSGLTGDSIDSHSTRSLGNSVQDACEAIVKDWKEHGTEIRKNQAASIANSAVRHPESAAPEMAARQVSSSKVSISSTPDGSDIEVDGSFVGSTPSTIELQSGEHSVVVKHSGYKDWERKIKISGGEVKVSADLQKNNP